MPDIVQTLGFEATAAIGQINQLTTSLNSLNQAFKTVGAGLKGFNGLSGGITKTLGAIQAGVNKTLQSLNQLNNVRVGQGGQFNPGQIASQFDLIRQQVAQTWGQLPSSVSAASRATYNTALGDLTKFASANKISSQQMLTAFAGLAGGSPVLNKLQQMVSSLGVEWQKAMDSIEKGSQRSIISMASLARFAGFYALMRVLTTLVSGFEEGVNAAVEFGRRLGEIGTISGGGNIQQITDRVAGFRKELIAISQESGRGLADIGMAYYETLSNQVGDATQAMSVFRESAELAVVTNTSLTDATNLMTAAINAWGLGAEQAAEVSATLFRAIELGRFRANELANILGRVGPIAREMGIGLDEAMSALTVMSIQGTRADTAVTQLRATMTGLLKPSEALSAVFRDMYGVENAEQAIIVAGGFGPLLQDLRKQAGATASELAELFKNVRSITGVAGMTGVKEMSVDLEKLRATSAKTFDEMYEFVQQQPAQKAAVAFNNLKVALEEMANVAIPAITSLANSMTFMIQNLGNLTMAVSLGALAYTARYIPALLTTIKTTYAAVVANFSLQASFVALWPFLLAAGVAGLTLFLLNEAKAADKAAEATAKLREERIKSKTESQAANTREDDLLRQRQMTEQSRFLAQQGLASKQTLEGLRTLNAAQVAMVKRFNQELLGAHQALLDKMHDAEKNYRDTVDKANSTRFDRQQEMEEKVFDWKMEALSKEQEVSQRIGRSRDLATKAQGILAKVGRGEVLTEEDLRRAESLFQLAQGQAEAAGQGARNLKDSTEAANALKQARTAELSIMKQMIGLENARVASAKLQKDQVQAETKRQDENADFLTRKLKVIEEGATAYKKVGDSYIRKSNEELRVDMNAALQAYKDIDERFSRPENIKSLSVLDRLGLQKQVADFKEALSRVGSVAVKLDTNYQEFKSILESESKKLPINLTYELARATGTDIKDITSFSDIIGTRLLLANQIKELETKTEGARGKMIAYKESVVDVNKALASIDLEDIQRKISRNLDPEMATVYANEITRLRKEGLALAGLPAIKLLDPVTNLPTDRLKQFIDDIRNIDLPSGMKKPGFASLVREFDTAKKIMVQGVADMAKAINELGQIDPLGRMTESLRLKQAAFESITIKITEMQRAAEGAAGVPIVSAESVTNAQAVGAALDNTKSASGQWVTDAQTTKGIIEGIKWPQPSSAPAGTEATPEFWGGLMRYYSGGGFVAKGTDTIPAMLSPGEFVMNARSTRRFFSQLVAMNAGSSPQYRASGGSITNVGDINLSVSSSGTEQQTARKLAVALRRELRRKTSTL